MSERMYTEAEVDAILERAIGTPRTMDSSDEKLYTQAEVDAIHARYIDDASRVPRRLPKSRWNDLIRSISLSKESTGGVVKINAKPNHIDVTYRILADYEHAR